MKKSEIKELETKQADLRSRSKMQLRDFWADVNATARYYKINDMRDKLTYNGDLIDSEREILLSRYELIKDLTKHEISVLRTLINNTENNRIFVGHDEIYINDFAWDENEVIEKVNYMKKLGIKKIYFHDSSTAALRNLVWLINNGCTVIGTSEKDDKEGLVIEVK